MADRPTTPRYDVFLSHNGTDKDAVEAIARRLVAHGVRPFLDAWHLVPGQPWQEELEEALDQSSACAIFLGPSGISPWQNEEMRAALEGRVRTRSARVVPVLLPGAVPDAETVPRFLRRLTWCDFRSGLDDATSFGRLLAGVSGVVPGPPDDVLDATPGRGGPLPETSRTVDAPIDPIDRALLRLRARPYAWKRQPMLDDLVKTVRTSGPPLVLRGLSGVGKTTLLAQTALELRTEFPEAFAVSFVGPAAVEPGYLLEELNTFLTRLGRGIPEQQVRERDQLATFQALLERLLGLRALILLDAVDRAPPPWPQRLLAELPALPTIRVIATVQDRLPPGSTANVVSVPPLGLDEAVQLVGEMARALGVTGDPRELVARAPDALATNPQALIGLLAHLRDLPEEFLLLDHVPEDARAPLTWMERSLEAMDERDRRVLALVEPLCGVDLASTLRLLELPLPDGFQSSLELLLARSFLMRTGRVMECPLLVADAMRTVAPELRTAACEEVTRALSSTTKRQLDDGTDTLPVAEVAAQVAVHLSREGHSKMLLAIARSDFLDLLNLRGAWKEYALLLRLGLEAAEATQRREVLVELGCRLARKLPQMGDPAGGREALRRVEELIGADGDTLEHAELYSHRALLSWVDDDELALQELVRSRTIRQAHDDKAGLVVVWKLIGNVLLRRREYAAARAAYEEALAVGPAAGLEKHRLDAETSLAFCDLGEGRPEEADVRLRGVIGRMHELRYDVGQLRALFGLALALERRGDAVQALATAREAASFAEAEPDLARAVEMLAWRLETDMTLQNEQEKQRLQR